MAKRLISLHELDDVEGLAEHHHKVQECIESAEADAAQFDAPVQGALELSRKANGLRNDLVVLLEGLAERLKK